MSTTLPGDNQSHQKQGEEAVRIPYNMYCQSHSQILAENFDFFCSSMILHPTLNDRQAIDHPNVMQLRRSESPPSSPDSFHKSMVSYNRPLNRRASPISNWNILQHRPSSCSSGSDDSHYQSHSSSDEASRQHSNLFSENNILRANSQSPKQNLARKSIKEKLRNMQYSLLPFSMPQFYQTSSQGQMPKMSTDDKLMLQKQKRQEKNLKIRQNLFESYSLEVERQRRLQQDAESQLTPNNSPPYLISLKQEPNNSTTYDQATGINAIATTSRHTPSPSGSSTESAGNPSKRNKIANEPVRLTEYVYKTEPGYMVPRRDAKGVIKQCQCKKKECGQLFDTKHELWVHTRIHLADKKILECEESYCSFVTGHQHHLEYHRNLHTGKRQFKCQKCSYAAPNKATLTSHEKSHVNFFHFTCKDCNTKVKYEHMFKKHLRKTGHRIGEIRNSDGVIDHNKIIDIMGSKRGPKNRKTDSLSDEKKQNNAPENFSFPVYQNQNQFYAKTSEISHFGQMDTQSENESSIAENLVPQDLSISSTFQSEAPLDLSTSFAMKTVAAERAAEADCPEVLSQEVKAAQVQDLPLKHFDNNKTTDKRTGTSKRKGKAVKLVHQQRQYELSDDEDDNSNIVTAAAADLNDCTPTSTSISVNQREHFECEFCEVSFGQLVMYSDHMQYHDPKDASVCAICKKRFSNQAEFYLHIGRENHSQYLQ